MPEPRCAICKGGGTSYADCPIHNPALLPEPRDNRCPKCLGTREIRRIMGRPQLCNHPFHTPAPPDHGESGARAGGAYSTEQVAPAALRPPAGDPLPDHGESERPGLLRQFGQALAERDKALFDLDQARADAYRWEEVRHQRDRAEASLATAREALRELVEASAPYVENAAPHEQLFSGDDLRNYERLTRARTRALDSISSDEGER